VALSGSEDRILTGL